MNAADSQYVNFSLPEDVSAELPALQRKQLIMQMLLQRGLQPTPMPENYGRRASPVSPLAPLAQMLQTVIGAKGAQSADTEAAGLAGRYNKSITDTLMAAQQARTGMPAMEGTPATGPTGQTSPSAGVPGVPAVPGNLDVANMLMVRNPITRPLGMELTKQSMESAAFVDALQKERARQEGGVPSSTGAGTVLAPGITLPPGVPRSALGGPAQGQPMSLYMRVDPTGKTYMEALGKDYERQHTPWVNRGYGGGTWDAAGIYHPDPASAQQAKELEQVKADIKAGYDNPITIHFSGGQDVILSPFETKEYYTTGKLPARYGGGGTPGPAAKGAGKMENSFAPSASATRGLGTPGLTQSQEDIIRQKGETSAAQQLGEGMGKEGTAVFSEGAQAVQANRQLDNMTQIATGFTPDRFQALKSTYGAYLAALPGMDEAQVNKMLGTSIGDIRALTSQAVQMAGKLTRQTDSQPSQIQFLKNLQSMPNADMTEEGFKKVIAYMKDMNNYRIEKMLAQQQWLQRPGGNISGFEADWAQKSKNLPFIWNQPSSKTKAPVAPKGVPGTVDTTSGAVVKPMAKPGQGSTPSGWSIEEIK